MESSYRERFATQWGQCGPGSWRYLAASGADAERGLRLLASPEGDEADRAEARRLVSAVLHPMTLEPIPLPFRMAAHVPANALLLVAMLSAGTPATSAVAQALNQTFNCFQFLANSSGGGGGVPAQTVAIAYAGAVVSSAGVAAGLLAAAQRARNPLLAAAVPFLGAASGKPLQIGFMRADEMTEGVVVTTEDGRRVGVSAAAGKRAVGLTIATRTLYLAPLLYLPTLQGALVKSVPLLQRSRPGALASYVLHSALHSALVTPACIALFDQRASMAGADLEPAFHAYDRLFFNKGL